MKKYVAIAAAAILLAGVVYFSCSLNKGEKARKRGCGCNAAGNGRQRCGKRKLL
ncbi:MAG: hypothetical protein V8Q85_06220 [Christensenellales bacterium]